MLMLLLAATAVLGTKPCDALAWVLLLVAATASAGWLLMVALLPGFSWIPAIAGSGVGAVLLVVVHAAVRGRATAVLPAAVLALDNVASLDGTCAEWLANATPLFVR